MSINSVNLTPNDYISNAQHVGLQRDAINRTKNEDASLHTTDDSVQLSLTEGPKAGAQTGMAQDKGKSESLGKTSEEGSVSAPKNEAENKNTQLALTSGNNNSVSFDSGMPGANIGGPSSAAPKPGCGPANPGTLPSSEDLGKIDDYAKKQQELMQKQLEIQQSWEKVFMQMFNSRMKHMEEMRKMMNETFTSIHESRQMTIAMMAKSRMSIMSKWSAVIGGYDK